MVYNKMKYIAKTKIYDPLRYVGRSIYSRVSDLFPCKENADFYYSGVAIETSEIIDELGNGYILEITDNLGVKLADGAQPISTNYVKFKENYPTLVTNDTTNTFFDIGGLAKIVLISDLGNIINDQYFIQKDGAGTVTKIGLYNATQAEPCYTKINRFFEFVDGLFDIDNSPLYDIDGSRLYALKDGVVRQ